MEIFEIRFLDLFLRIWEIRAMQRADPYSISMSALKKKRWNCSIYTVFSYLLNSYKRKLKFLNQNQLCSELKRGVDD